MLCGRDGDRWPVKGLPGSNWVSGAEKDIAAATNARLCISAMYHSVYTNNEDIS